MVGKDSETGIGGYVYGVGLWDRYGQEDLLVANLCIDRYYKGTLLWKVRFRIWGKMEKKLM